MAGEEHFGPVWFIPGSNKARYPHCNSVYIEGPGVLVDPASDRERLMELKKGPGVSEVWLSHWHEDHFMHLDLFDDVPFRITEMEAPPLADLDEFMRWYDMDVGDQGEWWKRVLKEQFHFRPRKPGGYLRPGERIALGPVTAEVIHAPGHTPGHLAFFFRGPDVLFLADYDLTRFGPWYGGRDSAIEDTISSVQMLRSIEAKVWITGHEPAEKAIMKKHLERLVSSGRAVKKGEAYAPA